MTEKFGILGYGYVGKATHIGLLKNIKCFVYDITFESKKESFANVDTIFICIPTADDHDIKVIVDEIKYFKGLNPAGKVIVRSTLPINSCKYIEQEINDKIIYIPEFLRERYWDTDCLRRPLIVGHNGCQLPTWLKSESIQECTLQEAELVKMFSNSFASMRIAFANLFYDLSQKVDANYDHVKDMYFKIKHDQTYMEVPGHDGSRGFSGKCLPKDLDFLITSLDELNVDSNWFKNIRQLNKEWQKKF